MPCLDVIGVRCALIAECVTVVFSFTTAAAALPPVAFPHRLLRGFLPVPVALGAEGRRERSAQKEAVQQRPRRAVEVSQEDCGRCALAGW